MQTMFQIAAFLADKDYGIFDPDKSIYYYNQSASLGFLEAQLLLASIYDDPSTAIYNPQKAFKFFETAAKQGHPEGLYFYGKMLLNG